MKKLLPLFFSFCLYLPVSAQKVFFIYLEAENNIPFYIRLGDKVYSSSDLGYLLLPNLENGNYTFFIGSASGGTKEARFMLNIADTDRGFVVGRSGEGITLFDLQDQHLLKPVQEAVNSNVTYERRSDAFTSLLSKASGDSSLLFMPIFAKTESPKPEEKKDAIVTKPEEVKPKVEETKAITQEANSNTEEVKPKTDLMTNDKIANKPTSDSVTANPLQTTVASENKNEKDIKEKEQKTEQLQSQNSMDSTKMVSSIEEYKKSVVKKHSESSTKEGFGLVFLDKDGEVTDTIRLLIPGTKPALKDGDANEDDKVFLDVKKDSVQSLPPVKDAGSQTTAMSSGTIKDSKVDTSNSKAIITKPANAKCTSQATESDFFKLRKNMAAKENDEAMVNEAKKSFRSKCYSTAQIKYLSSLFLTAAGKYQFFDAAYVHVSDQEQFPSLQTEIKDDYYLKRFKALIAE